MEYPCSKINYAPCQYSCLKPTGQVTVREGVFCKKAKEWIVRLNKCPLEKAEKGQLKLWGN